MGGRALGRVTKRADFQAFRKPSGRGRSGPLSVSFVAKSDQKPPICLAFAISKRCGGAVERNRLRRRLREAAVNEVLSVSPGMYLVRCEPEATTLTFGELVHHLGQAMSRAGKTGKEGHG